VRTTATGDCGLRIRRRANIAYSPALDAEHPATPSSITPIGARRGSPSPGSGLPGRSRPRRRSISTQALPA